MANHHPSADLNSVAAVLGCAVSRRQRQRQQAVPCTTHAPRHAHRPRADAHARSAPARAELGCLVIPARSSNEAIPAADAEAEGGMGGQIRVQEGHAKHPYSGQRCSHPIALWVQPTTAAGDGAGRQAAPDTHRTSKASAAAAWPAWRPRPASAAPPVASSWATTAAAPISQPLKAASGNGLPRFA